MPLTAPPPAPPLISVCMPVYNAERYVAEAVESILGQTFGDFELLIEDNSTDSTTAILERAMRARPAHPRGYPAQARPGGRPQRPDRPGAGEFLARMDADDIAMPDRFARQVAYLRGHPECVLVGSRVWEADAEGDPLGEYPTLPDHEEIDAFHFRMRGPALIHPSIMMRRDAVLAVGKYRGSQIEDVNLYLRLAERGRLARLPEFLLKYRIHADNASRSDDARMRSYQLLCEILGDAYRRRDLPVDLPPPEAMGFAPADPPCLERDRGWAWRSLTAGHPRTARKYAAGAGPAPALAPILEADVLRPAGALIPIGPARRPGAEIDARGPEASGSRRDPIRRARCDPEDCGRPAAPRGSDGPGRCPRLTDRGGDIARSRARIPKDAQSKSSCVQVHHDAE